jgi:DDE family transposase
MVLEFTRLTEETMTYEDYLLHLFYLIDSEVKALNLPRRRGPEPRLHDSEVITLELAGEFLGIDTDKGIWQHFRRYHGREFPALLQTDRTCFTRHAADLWRVKQLLQEKIAALLPAGDAVCGEPLWLIDSFPLRVCRFKRAPRHKLFRAAAAYGRDPTGEQLFFGFRVHLRCTERGFCAAATLAPANITDWPMVFELLPAEGGQGIGDRNYWNPREKDRLMEKGFVLHAPFRKESSDPMPQRSALLGRLRQIIEPVIGQLATRFHCQRTWARDLWHLCSRLTRKLLSHTTAVLLNCRIGNPPLQLELLIND